MYLHPTVTSFYVTQADLTTIRAAGFHIDESGGFAREDGERQETVTAIDARTRESFTVTAGGVVEPFENRNGFALHARHVSPPARWEQAGGRPADMNARIQKQWMGS